jgi:hypothetical protein
MTTFAASAQVTPTSAVPRLHPAIIEANLSLFRGERAEALRYLADYADEPDSHINHPLILWLNAQAQADPQDRVERLHRLIALVSEDNPYAQLARNMLENEERYASLPHPRQQGEKRLFGLPRRLLVVQLIIFALGLVALLVLSSNANRASATSTVTPAENPITIQAVTPTLLPIHAIPLPANGYDVQYSAGRLQVISVEDSSERIIGSNGETLVPIKGARFYALQVRFECKIGICDTPPEAVLALRVDNQLMVVPRDGAVVEASDSLQPIARGRSTSGWIIFEIPIDSVIDALLVAPKDSPEDVPPLFINLGATTR